MEINISEIVPTGSLVLLKVYNQPKQTTSGFIIADTNTPEAPVAGIIMTVGPDSTYKKDDMVLFRRYSLDELKYRDSEGEHSVYFLDNDDILATLKNGGEPQN